MIIVTLTDLKLTVNQPKNKELMNQIFYTILPSPPFTIGLAATSNGLLKLEIGVRSEPGFINELKREYDAMPIRKDAFFLLIKNIVPILGRQAGRVRSETGSVRRHSFSIRGLEDTLQNPVRRGKEL